MHLVLTNHGAEIEGAFRRGNTITTPLTIEDAEALREDLAKAIEMAREANAHRQSERTPQLRMSVDAQAELQI